MSVELRWAIDANTTTKAPVLQVRHQDDAYVWSAWVDVPMVVDETKPRGVPNFVQSCICYRHKPGTTTGWYCPMHGNRY